MAENTTGKAPTTPVEITYTQVGDYLIPDIEIGEDENSLPSLTKWGMMRKDYLQNHRRIPYMNLKTSGKLFLHCHEIEEQAKDRMELLMKQLVEANPISEDLKNTDTLAWVGHMNGLKAQAEEIVKAELIYA